MPIFAGLISASSGTEQGFPNPKTYPVVLNYCMTCWIGDTESTPSPYLLIGYPETVYDSGHGLFYGWQGRITLPAGIEGTTRRTIYRAEIYGDGGGFVYKLFDWDGNDPMTFTDMYRVDPGFKVPPITDFILSAWFGYDEYNANWNAPIIDSQGGKNRPEGKIFEILPSLNFVSPNSNQSSHQASGREIFCFFGSDNSYETVKEQWIDLMLSKKRARATFKSMTLRDDDSVRIASPFHLQGIVTKAVVNPINETTEIEMVQR